MIFKLKLLQSTISESYSRDFYHICDSAIAFLSSVMTTRSNEIVDVNSGNEVFFDALLGAISWRPPPERCNYTSG